MLVIGIILATSMSLYMYALTPSRQLASAQMRPESAKFRAAWILHRTDVNLLIGLPRKMKAKTKLSIVTFHMAISRQYCKRGVTQF